MLGSDGKLKLVDFGSAHFIREKDEVSNLVGTYAFMAPEMVNRENKQMFKAKKLDIWAAGVTLFYWMCEKIPFSGRRYNELTTAIINETVVLPDTVSLELRDLFYKLLDKNPATRSTLSELLNHEWLNN
jgi:[calcium/calmodulin-dependent protein kinase] kinase